jgi:hypothetical protein
MSPRRPALFAFLVSLSLLSVLPGCGPSDPGHTVPDQAPDCPTQFGEDTLEKRKVDIGDAASGDLVPYQDGEQVPLVRGGQGLSMITPWVQIAAAADDGEEVCCVVRLDNDPGLIESNQFNVQFARRGAAFLSDGAIYHPFGPDHDVLVGETVKVTAKVRCDGFEGERTVTVSLK